MNKIYQVVQARNLTNQIASPHAKVGQMFRYANHS